MASTYLTRTASAGNRRTWTFSGWIKRSNISAEQHIWSSNNGSNYSTLGFQGGVNNFYYYDYAGSTVNSFYTSQVFRDVSAWYHIVFAYDSTQATSSNRMKLYVNNSQVTSFSSSSYPSLNYDSFANVSGYVAYIGTQASGGSYYDGSMSHVHFIDGTAYDASAFGETDATTGIWKPKTAPSVTYGTNGFFLKGENSGSLGTDSSGNANNFTVNGTPTQTIDTPSNVFCNWNALSSSSYQTLSNGNSTSSGNTSLDNGNVYANLAVTKGKYYAEFKVTVDSGYPFVGIANMEKAGYYGTINGGTGYIGSSNLSPNVSYDSEGRVFQDGSLLATYTTPVTNDIIGLAVDLDNGAFYASINGTWQNSGDPTSGASKTGAVATWTPIDTLYTFGTANYNSGNTKANFGNGFFGTTAVASAQNPDDGIGIFEFSVPTGYKSLCTKSINAQEYS